MATIEFRDLSLHEAEEVLAEIWNCLEEYDIPSPHMTFGFGGKAEVALACRFAEPLWARLVAIRLSNWVLSSDQRAAIGGRRGETIGRCSLFSDGPPVAPRGASHLAVAALRSVTFDRAR